MFVKALFHLLQLSLDELQMGYKRNWKEFEMAQTFSKTAVSIQYEVYFNLAIHRTTYCFVVCTMNGRKVAEM